MTSYRVLLTEEAAACAQRNRSGVARDNLYERLGFTEADER